MRKLLLSLASLLFAELLLALLGYPTNTDRGELLPGTITTDPVLGWRHLPASLNAYSEANATPIKITFWSDGTRATSKEITTTIRPRILLLGCSFTEGFGLSDEETFAWKFQSQRPAYAVVNLGTGGYGTYQSILRLKQYLQEYPPTPQSPIARIVYFFADFHTWRNIRNPQSQRFWHTPGIFPICGFDQGLACTTWSGKKPWSVSSVSRIASLIENVGDTISVLNRKDEAIRVTQTLIRELQDFGRQHATATDIAVIVHSDNSWLEFLSAERIPFTDCVNAELKNKSSQLPDGHPNARGAGILATCLEGIIP